MSSTLIHSLDAYRLRRYKTNQRQHIESPQIRRDRATLREYKKAQQLTDRVPIKEILREAPKSRLRSGRPFVIEAARLANLNQTEQETWEQSRIQGVAPGHDLVTIQRVRNLGSLYRDVNSSPATLMERPTGHGQKGPGKRDGTSHAAD